jgi:hypothetical protein
VFLTIFHVLQCLCLIFHGFQSTCHNACPTVFISTYSRSYHPFQCLSPYFTSDSVFLIFHDFQFSHHTPGSTVFASHFPHFSVYST